MITLGLRKKKKPEEMSVTISSLPEDGQRSARSGNSSKMVTDRPEKATRLRNTHVSVGGGRISRDPSNNQMSSNRGNSQKRLGS